MLPITDQEPMEITFAVITPLGNSLEVYIDPIVESPPHHYVGPSFCRLNQLTHLNDSDSDVVSSQDVETDLDGSESSPSYVDLNRTPANIEEDPTQLGLVSQEDVHHQPIEEKLDDPEVKALDPNFVAYMEAPASELKNASTWAGVAIGSPWMPFPVVAKFAEDGSLYKSQIFRSKEEVVHAVKTFSLKTHQEYFVYKSSKSLLKFKCKQP